MKRIKAVKRKIATKKKVSETENFKRELEKEKEQIEKELKELDKPTDFGNDTYDSETLETQEFVNKQSIAQVLKSRLGAITSALWKIMSRKYGKCERCGKEIEPELLKLVPESRLCKECKKLQKQE